MKPLIINADVQWIPIPDESVHCIVTSPPYYGKRKYSGNMMRVWGGTRDCKHEWIEDTRTMQTGGASAKQRSNAGVDGSGWIATESSCSKCGAWWGELGLERDPGQYIKNMVAFGREMWRVLRPDGTMWVVIADTHAGSGGAGGDYNAGGLREGQPKYKSGFKPNRSIKYKDLMGIPWAVAEALRNDGWFWRREIIWWKPNPMPESPDDRPSTAHEFIFLFSKSRHYFYDGFAVKEPSVSDKYDRKKMREKRDRIGGKHLGVADELMAANNRSRVGQKRAVGDPALGRNRRSIFEPVPDWDGFVHFLGERGVDLVSHFRDYLQAAERIPETVWFHPTVPYKGAHFATYPPGLLETPIAAGTSEHGVCAQCGTPWERVVEKPDMDERPVRGPNSKWNPASGEFRTANWGESPQSQGWQYQEWREQNPDIHVGWEPGCDHNAEVVPAIVYDPFVGSGTTLLKAVRMGRRGIGTDLSFEYLRDTAAFRLGLAQLRAWVDGDPIDGTPKPNGHKNMKQPRAEMDRSKQRNNAHSIHRARVNPGSDDGQLSFLED